MSSIETNSGEETGVEYSGDFLEDTKQATRSIQRLVRCPFSPISIFVLKLLPLPRLFSPTA